MKEDRSRLLAAALLISVATGTLLLAARQIGVFEALELMSYDLMVSVRPETADPPSVVTLIAVTEQDIAELGRWPLSDATLAAALGAVLAQRPRVVGLDIYRDIPVPPGTDTLNELLDASSELVGIFKFHTPGSVGVAPNPRLAAAGRVGFSDFVLDDGAVVRRGLAFLDDGTATSFSFPLVLALGYLTPRGITLAPDPLQPAHFRLGEVTIPPLGRDFGGYVDMDNAGYQFMVDYARGQGAFTRHTFGALMARQVPPGHLQDRIVIVGVDAASVKDSFATPLGNWSWSTAPSLPGIELHAHVTDQLLSTALAGARPLAAWNVWAESALVFGACLAGGLTALRSRSARRLASLAAAGLAAVCVLCYLAFLQRLWLPAVPMAAGWIGASALVTGYLLQRTGRDRTTLQRLLSLQVSPAVALTIWQHRDELLEHGVLKPQQLTATVLFVDLQGFTRLSETLTPDDLIAWLRPFMDLATRMVLSHRGMVDDYFGDGIKANFGVPVASEDPATDAQRAVRCALALREGARQLSATAHHAYRLRFGIHTGPVLAASVGSRERLKYTTVGDTVNVAARLEALAKETMTDAEYGRILVSADTAELVGAGFQLSSLGSVTLRGKSRSAVVYRIEQFGQEPASTHLEQRQS